METAGRPLESFRDVVLLGAGRQISSWLKIVVYDVLALIRPIEYVFDVCTLGSTLGSGKGTQSWLDARDSRIMQEDTSLPIGADSTMNVGETCHASVLVD